MKTDNFKIRFNVIDDFRETVITFGFTEIDIRAYDKIGTIKDDLILEHYRFSYYNKGVLKMSVTTFDLPLFLYNAVNRLFYGFYAYDKGAFSSSPALECVALVRSLQNYYKRIGKSFI
jgi:hypothetical protein